MTDKATLEEIEAEISDEPSFVGLILENHAPRLLDICREQREAIGRLKHFGGMLSNCAFSAKQMDEIPERFRTSLRVAQEDWDLAIKAIGTKK